MPFGIGLNPRKIKLKNFIKQIAIDSGYNRKITYTIYVTFLKELQRYLKLKRQIYIPGIGEFYLKKSIILIHEEAQQYERIRFRPARTFKRYVNNYKGAANGKRERTDPSTEADATGHN